MKRQGVTKMNDWSAVIVAIISLFGTFLGALTGAKLSSYRIGQLEKQVERLSGLFERQAVTENNITVLNHRVSDLERGEMK